MIQNANTTNGDRSKFIKKIVSVIYHVVFQIYRLYHTKSYFSPVPQCTELQGYSIWSNLFPVVTQYEIITRIHAFMKIQWYVITYTHVYLCKLIVPKRFILKSLETRMFVQLVQANNTRNIKVLHFGPLWGESTGHRQTPLIKDQ